MAKDYRASDARIGRTWNTWNAAFRRGFYAYESSKMNTGNPKGSCSERGFWFGWIWCRDGKAMPDDPMWTTLMKRVAE